MFFICLPVPIGLFEFILGPTISDLVVQNENNALSEMRTVRRITYIPNQKEDPKNDENEAIYANGPIDTKNCSGNLYTVDPPVEEYLK